MERVRVFSNRVNMMRKGFWVKLLSKAAALGMLVSLACSTSVPAYQTEQESETVAQIEYQSVQVSESVPVKTWYMDDFNMIHCLSGEISCNGTIEWSEDTAGWISNVDFGAYLMLDDEPIALDDTGETVVHMNVAYKRFEINGSGLYVNAVLTCDEYGNYSVSGSIDK